MSLYNCCLNYRMDGSDDLSYRITKFDDDFNVESSYLVTRENCECPQGHKPTCRHRKMLPQFLVTKRTNTQWFLDYDTGAWRELHLGMFDEPLAEEASPSVEQPEEVQPHSPPPASTSTFLRRI